jgi:hypothetical protein
VASDERFLGCYAALSGIEGQLEQYNLYIHMFMLTLHLAACQIPDAATTVFKYS